MKLPGVILKPGRERSVRRWHPWLFSGGIARVDEMATDGGLVDVFSSRGEWLARGYLNRVSQITVRLLTWDREQRIDDGFWRGRLARAGAGRAALEADPGNTAYRLVNAESDGLPGLIVDRYGDWLVLQASTSGMERIKGYVADVLLELHEGICGVFERSDVAVRAEEGLEPVTGVLRGEEPSDLIGVKENGFQFLVDIKHGQKTGFYLDQRANRARLMKHSADAEVLNAFAYTGAFSVYALAGGAQSVVNLDTSDQALVLARRHVALNGFGAKDVGYDVADVFAQLRAYRASHREFDLAILDPPQFATSRSHVKQASRGYKDINWIALQILRRGGVLFTCSCSAHISRDLFQKIVFGAALDAGREVQIIGHLNQAEDHPVSLQFPEAAYLKGLICRVW